MQLLRRAAASLVLALLASLGAGCSAPAALLVFAVEQGNNDVKDPTCLSPGCAAVAMLQHAYDRLTEGGPTSCSKLNTVERALSGRCGTTQAGSLLTKDVTHSGLPLCPLSLAAREPRFWPLLPELLSKGAQPETCEQAPLAALAQAQPCPDFTAASAESLQGLRWLAEVDARSVQHDVVRLLSCPAAQTAGLAKVLDVWLAQGLLPRDGLLFSPLGALHPTYLGSAFAQALEARGHTAAAALVAQEGMLPTGFDAALRSGHRAALDWWLDRVPTLANRVPASRTNQLPWLPLARVITPSYLTDPSQQTALVAYLMSRGADPWRQLPHEPKVSVVGYARQLNSPSLAALDPPLLWPTRPGEQAASLTARVAGAGLGATTLIAAPR